MIRAATAADLPGILPMIDQICALHESWDRAKYGVLPHPAARYESWLQRLIVSPQHLCLVADDRSPTPARLVGFLIATVESEIPIYRLRQFAFIQDLWVEPDARRAGIARQLIMQAIDHFRQQGIEQIRLDTAIANEAARSLFSACGFRPSVVEMLIEL